MVATYTPNLRLTLQGDNDNPNTWGQVVNQQVTALLEEAISGVASVNITGSSNVDLSSATVNGATDSARHAVLELTGTLGANIQLILPAVEKVYLIRAAYTGAFTVNVRPSGGGSGIDFEVGKTSIVYTNGTSIYEAVPSDVLRINNNLSDLGNVVTARTNLGLGTAALEDAGTGPNQVLLLDGSGNPPAYQGFVPAGCLLPFAGTAAPAGYLLCAGQTVSRATYATLFAVLGTTYGAGDGSTFGLPDLRGRVVAGKDDMGGTSANRLTSPINGDTLGAAGGSESHTLTEAEMPAHNHRVAGNTAGTDSCWQISNVATALGGTSQTSGFDYYDMFNRSGVTPRQIIEDTGSGTAHNNVQPTIILNYVIKT